MKAITEGNYIAAFTDGSSYISKDQKYYEASSAVVIIINDKEVCRLGCFHKNGTNSIGEVYALMLAIEKVEELKRDNPELNDYFTFYVSDSRYFVQIANECVYTLEKLNRNSDIWKSSSGNPVAYQFVWKYLFEKYFTKQSWLNDNMIIHMNGHITGKKLIESYKKAFKRNSNQTWAKQRAITLDAFKWMVDMNNIVDHLAEMIRTEKLYYFEKGSEDSKWVKRKRNIPTRNQRWIIRSRKNESKI